MYKGNKCEAAVKGNYSILMPVKMAVQLQSSGIYVSFR